MPVKLLVRLQSDPSETGLSEQTYTQEIIRIGRQEGNDLYLSDPRRSIGRQHAEIQQKENQFFLIDKGSKNGTCLNGRRLAPGKAYPLSQADQITVGEFVIQICPLTVVESQSPSVEDTNTIYRPPLNKVTQELAEELNRIYWNQMELSAEERQQKLFETLRLKLNALDPSGARKVLDLLEIQFPEPEYQAQKAQEAFKNESFTETSAGPRELCDRAYKGISDLAEQWLKTEAVLQSGEDVDQFIQRMGRLLTLMTNCLSHAVKGRKQFQQEFDTETTKILSWKPNPVKLAETGEAVRAYLMDWKKEENLDKVASELEEAFTDLTLHQIGLMAGFKQGLKGLLQTLDPQGFEARARVAPMNVGPFPIPPFWAPLVRLAAWDKYKERYNELAENDHKTFENVWNQFAEGYLSVHKQKKRP